MDFFDDKLANLEEDQKNSSNITSEPEFDIRDIFEESSEKFDLLEKVYGRIRANFEASLIEVSPKLTFKLKIHLIIKRIFDLFFAILFLLFTFPLLLFISAIIIFDTPGPVFFSQERIGQERRKSQDKFIKREKRSKKRTVRPFKIIKFRTMVNDAEKATGPVWALKNDPRVTKIGRFLRDTRIDEIPQLFNIIFGQMSFVGPRPEREYFILKYHARVMGYKERFLFRPGITGLAQIENGYDASETHILHKLFYDIYYIRNFSIWLDFMILLKTVGVVVRGSGAH